MKKLAGCGTLVKREREYWIRTPFQFKHSFFLCLGDHLGGGGYSWEFLVGVCRQVLQILTLFETKKCHFFTPFFRLGH